MLIFSINRSRGYENPSLDIIVIECCSTGGCPLEEACEHCYLIQVLFLFKCYFCCYFVYHFCVLWRLCWIYYCYSVISSILFLFCIFYISGILHPINNNSKSCNILPVIHNNKDEHDDDHEEHHVQSVQTPGERSNSESCNIILFIHNIKDEHDDDHD